MSTALDLTNPPDDFEKFGRLVWDQLNTVSLSSGSPIAATHIAVQSALILANRTENTAPSEGAGDDAYLDRIFRGFN